jgi:hypothetical protein
MEYYYGAIKSPLREAIATITGEEPPLDLCPPGVHSTEGMHEDTVLLLQDWCAEHARPKWATGLWVLDAAEDCVRQAVDNANIAPNAEIRG